MRMTSINIKMKTIEEQIAEKEKEKEDIKMKLEEMIQEELKQEEDARTKENVDSLSLQQVREVNAKLR